MREARRGIAGFMLARLLLRLRESAPEHGRVRVIGRVNSRSLDLLDLAAGERGLGLRGESLGLIFVAWRVMERLETLHTG